MKTMLIDLHAHSKGISRCCKADGRDVVIAARDSAIDGIVLTNHYDKGYVKNNKLIELALKYKDEYLYVKRCGEEIGVKVFFGIEVTMAKYDNVHLLIYGVDEDFVINYPDIFDYTHEELYNLVKKYNGILIQAHPFRRGKDVLLDLNYLDGVEANCHPLYDGTYIDRLSKLASDNNLILTCGGDYHADTYRAKCGVYFPVDIKSSRDIVDYLKTAKTISLCIQETNEMTTYEFKYERK